MVSYIYGLGLSNSHPSFVDFIKQEYCAVLTLPKRPLSIFIHSMVWLIAYLKTEEEKSLVNEQRKLHYG